MSTVSINVDADDLQAIRHAVDIIAARLEFYDLPESTEHRLLRTRITLESMLERCRPTCEENQTDPACPDCGAVDCERAKSSSSPCSSGFAPGHRKVCSRCGRMNCSSITGGISG